ncbi:MAG: monovalent cation/H+ antiporter complex subunit F [Salinarimonas sp.]
MSSWYLLLATGLLLTIGGALWRVWRGPDQADRMMAAQLVGTGGVATILLLAAATGEWAMLDVALVLALLAALAAIAFVKSVRGAGHGDPEDDTQNDVARADEAPR